MSWKPKWIILLGALLITCLYAAEPDKSQIVDSGDKVLVNLNEADVDVVIKYLSKFSNEHYLIDPTVKGKITVMANKPLTKKQAIIVLEEALVFHGFTITQRGLAKRVVPTRVAKQNGIDVKYGMEDLDNIKSANLEMRFFKMEYIGVRQMNTLLNSIVGRNGQIIPYPEERFLQVIDTSFGMQRMAELVEKMDVPDSLLELYVVHLQNTDAAKMVGQLKTVFNKNLTLENSPNVIEAEEDRINFIADERTNTVLVITHPKYIEQIRETVAILDRELGKIQQMQMFPIKYAEGDEIVKNLNEIFPKDSVKILFNERINSLLILSQSDRMIQEVMRTAKRLDLKGPEEASDMHVYYLEHAEAKDVSDILMKLFEKRPKKSNETISVVPDETTNSLVITASKVLFREMMQIIKKLDIFRAQVLVEAVVAEVSISNNKDIGTMFFGTTVDGDNAGIINVLKAPDLTAGFNVGVLGSELGADESLSDVISDPMSRLRALFSMSKTKSHLNVLSCPQILTMDNEEATITVGQVIPVQTGEFQGGTSSSTNYRFEDVGLNLTIKPRITQKKTISMDIDLEVKSKSNEVTSNALLPVINKKTLNTSINTRDTGTIVIGGLIDDRYDDAEQSTPLLSDLPLLGKLFRHRSKEKRKVNLFIFLTPHILTSDEDVKNMTHKISANMKLSLDGGEARPLTFDPKTGRFGKMGSGDGHLVKSNSRVIVEKISIDGIRETVEVPSYVTKKNEETRAAQEVLKAEESKNPDKVKKNEIDAFLKKTELSVRKEEKPEPRATFKIKKPAVSTLPSESSKLEEKSVSQNQSDNADKISEDEIAAFLSSAKTSKPLIKKVVTATKVSKPEVATVEPAPVKVEKVEISKKSVEAPLIEHIKKEEIKAEPEQKSEPEKKKSSELLERLGSFLNKKSEESRQEVAPKQEITAVVETSVEENIKIQEEQKQALKQLEKDVSAAKRVYTPESKEQSFDSMIQKLKATLKKEASSQNAVEDEEFNSLIEETRESITGNM